MRHGIVVVREYPDHSGIVDVTLCVSYDHVKLVERLDQGHHLVHVYEVQDDEPIAQTIEVNHEGSVVK